MEYLYSKRISNLKPSPIREIVKAAAADPTIIPFAAGNPAPEAFPKKEIAAITEKIMSENPIAALQYGVSEGYAPLREAIKAMHEQEAKGSEVIVTSGAQQAIELSVKVFCNEGDVIICEDPSFIGSLNAFRSHGAVLVGVEYQSDGMNMEKLENALKNTANVKMIYTIPNFQNPTGKTMSASKRAELYGLAKKYNVVILEDNPYGDLRYSGEHVPSIKSMDADGLVIYCGSFSKTISPGLRVGYVIFPSAMLSKFTPAKQVADVHTPMLAQLIVYEFLKTCNLKDHINKTNEIYKHKLKLMHDGLAQHTKGKFAYDMPEGGLFIYGALPPAVKMQDFVKAALENKVAVVPGSAFCIDSSAPCNDIRLNFSTPTNEQIVRGIEVLGKLL